MSKPIKTPPIILNYAADSFADFALQNSDVGGKGLVTKNIEEENCKVSTRIAYSNTTPGLVVVHAFAGPIFDNTPLNTFLRDRKFKAFHLNPRKATADALRKIMFAARRRRETTWTDAEIEADIAHLLREPEVKAYWEAA